MAKDDAMDVEAHDEHLFLFKRLTLNFLGHGDHGVFHFVDCSFDSGSYRLIQVLSEVTILLRKPSPSRSNR